MFNLMSLKSIGGSTVKAFEAQYARWWQWSRFSIMAAFCMLVAGVCLCVVGFADL